MNIPDNSIYGRYPCIQIMENYEKIDQFSDNIKKEAVALFMIIYNIFDTYIQCKGRLLFFLLLNFDLKIKHISNILICRL